MPRHFQRPRRPRPFGGGRRASLFGFNPISKSGDDPNFPGLGKAEQAFNLAGRFRGELQGDLETLLRSLRGSAGFTGLEEFKGQVSDFKREGLASIGDLRQNLIGGALGNTIGSQVAAGQAARNIGGGRGGLAFGGGAGAIAGLAAQQGATQQAGLLGGALGQANRAELGVLGQALRGQGQAAQLGLGLTGLEQGLSGNFLGQQGALFQSTLANFLGIPAASQGNFLSGGGASGLADLIGAFG